jgi:hypothetical protein
MNENSSPPGPETEKPPALTRGVIENFHQKNNAQPVGLQTHLGPLRQILDSAINEAALNDISATLADFTVLSPQNDPYRLDLPDNHRNGEWFAEIVARLVPEGDSVHLRGLHYRLAAAADIIRPDNSLPYINTDEAWVWLTTKAAKAGRWLGYVDFERIIDERNAPPELFLSYSDTWRRPELSRGASVEVPTLNASLPTFHSYGFDVQQPYRIILIGEKTSLREVSRPIAELVGGELLLPTGEMSDTMVAGVAARAAVNSRPSVALYFSDFDPSGHQMPISVARKLQALRDLRYPELDIQVHHVALTLDQVRRLELPSTPLKETERRGDRWRAVMHHEQTEIDALAALRPDDLREIALDAIKPFYDRTLKSRAQTANSLWRNAAQRLLKAHPSYQAAVNVISDARDALEEAADTLQGAQDAAQRAFEDIELPPVDPPEPMIDATAPRALFTTEDDYATAARRLIAHKSLDSKSA